MNLWSVSRRLGMHPLQNQASAGYKLEGLSPSPQGPSLGLPRPVLSGGGSQVLRKWKFVRSLENVGLELVHCCFPYLLLSKQIGRLLHNQGMGK